MCGCGDHRLHSEGIRYENVPLPASSPMRPTARVNTVACPGCGAAIQEDFVFCPNCGRQILTACPQCHRAAQADWTRCAFCGADLIAQPTDSAQPNL